MPRLTIDTSSTNNMFSVTSNLHSAGHTLASGTSVRHGRERSLSTASTSSSLSITSPSPSSGNPSTSSLHLPSTGMTSDAGPGQFNSSDEHSMDELYSPEIQDEYVLAMHDFVPQHPNATCLSFRAGQIIRVLNRDPSGWWDGELEGRRGWFPSNYVNKEVASLTEEELPQAAIIRKGHTHTQSEMSVTSWASTPSPGNLYGFKNQSRKDSKADLLMHEESHSCPTIMVSLLHGLQLLQNAVRARRVTHYQPAVACIISCIRSVLSATDCLPREAPILKRHSILAQERKNVLSDLASLVAQAKKASAPFDSEDEREPEEDLMLRLSGQVFARVRRFLAVAVQCGVELPERRNDIDGSTAYDSTDTEGRDRDSIESSYSYQANPNGDHLHGRTTPMRKSLHGNARRPSHQHQDSTSSSLSTRAKSLTDLRSERNKTLKDDISEDSCTPLINTRSAMTPRMKQQQYSGQRAQSHVRGQGSRSSHLSISSTSSFSSSSSYDSFNPPITPSFPSGPCTSNQVLSVLRATHDNLLSTIAAFIGHVHSHSRSAHASSTGHMYELVRQIVEMVCKLLTIVDAVMHHPDIPLPKTAALKVAKDSLYGVTSALADCVREMTTTEPPQMSEEDEKRDLLRLATDALKAGSDCVAAVKLCLGRSVGEDAFIVNLSNSPTDPQMSFTPHKRVPRAANGAPLMRSPSLGAIHEQFGFSRNQSIDDEDATIHTHTHTHPSSIITLQETSSEGSNNSSSSRAGSDEDTNPTSSGSAQSSIDQVNERKSPLQIETVTEAVEADLPSPTSVARTETDGTTWEGSHTAHSLTDKLINGELPSVPLPGDDTIHESPLSWSLSHDYAPEHVAYNGDGHLVGATLGALVEKMTPHDSIVDPAFSAVFFLTFRLFSTPVELLDTLIARYNLDPPTNLNESDFYTWQQRKMLPVRLRVSNFIKLWLEMYWRPETDEVALPLLMDFVKNTMSEMFLGASQRIADLINVRLLASQSVMSPTSAERSKVGDRLRDAGMPLNPPILSASEIPRPIMTKALLSALRSKNFASIAITDFDALELARQLAIIECTLYCAITSEEVLEMGQSGAAPAVNVKALSTLSTVITGWVAESILNEPDMKKRTLLIKFFIKVADRCTTINNFSTPRSILAALDSSTIARLHQTWLGLPQKNKTQLESLRKLADHARNYHGYRSRLRNTAPPAVPFLGLYLTDLTFCREGNISTRASPIAPNVQLLNFNKYHKLARIVQDMQRFQVPFNLKEIPEVQEYLQYCFEKSKHHGDLEDLYRRSLLVEPKQPADAPPTSELKQLFGWGNRSTSQTSQTSQATL